MPRRCSPPRSSSTSSTSSFSCCRCSIGTDGYSAMKLSRLLGAAGAAERGPPRLFRRRDRLAQLGAAHHRGPAREASCWSTSGRTRASTGCARSATSARGRETYEDHGLGRDRRPHARVPVRARRRQRPPRPRRTWRSSIRSRSTATTRSGAPSTTSYWPAVYIADAEGRIRHHHFGEGGYEECEMVIQRLLGEAGRERRR